MFFYNFHYDFQGTNGQQNGVATNCQQTVLNNPSFTQTVDPASFNVQTQQSAKQAPNSQSYNLQQLANIPMQTFNVQQPVNFQLQGNSPPAMNQAISIQQIPQSTNLQDVQKQDVYQTLSNPENLQHTSVIQQFTPQQPSNVKTTPQSVNIHQTLPIQAINLQQQSYPVNLQQQQVPAVNLQHPAPQQCVNYQNSVVTQQGNSQQQAAVHNVNVQQVTPLQANFQQASQPYVNMQQHAVHKPQPTIVVQPGATYQQPVAINEPIVKQLSIQKCPPQEPYNVQQMQLQQIDSQIKQVPCNNIGAYQIIAYQNPCQQPDVSTALPMSLHVSKVSNSPCQAIIGAIPAAISDSNKIVQKTDHIYLAHPQSYVNPGPYPPVLTENMQQVSSGLNVMPITVGPSPHPFTAVNFVTSNPNQYSEVTDNQSVSLKPSDLGILSILQGQFPMASLLNQPTSSIQSALLSSILSSIPSSSPQYTTGNYPAQTVLCPQCNSQNSKFSLKSLLPLLLNLLQEKYTGCGCQCHCCNCERSQNDDVVHETSKPDEIQEVKEETTEEPSFDSDDSLEEEDISIYPRGKSKYQNMIPDDSTEIDETQNSPSVNEPEGIDTEDVDDLSNDGIKL